MPDFILTKITQCDNGNKLLKFNQGASVEVAPGVRAMQIVPNTSRRIFVSSCDKAVGDIVPINVELLKEVPHTFDNRTCTYWELK